MSTHDRSGENGGQARVTRRDFLRIGGLTMLGSVLAACGGAAPAAAPAAGGAGARLREPQLAQQLRPQIRARSRQCATCRGGSRKAIAARPGAPLTRSPTT